MANLKESNLLVRMLTGTGLVVVMVGAALLSEWTFAALLLVIALGCLWEFYRLAEAAGFEPQRRIGIAIATIWILCTLLSVRFFSIYGILVSLLIYLPITTVCLFVELYRKKPNPLGNVAVTVLGLLYTVLPANLLFLLGFSFVEFSMDYTPWVVLSYILVVWANDIGAYLVGVTCGKHRLFERISPQKSWEGFFGGVAVAIGAALLAGWMQGDSLWKWSLLGALIAVTGVLGDLIESMFKRSVGVKDSGRIMPGHGGFLDRFDALIFSAPFVFIFFVCWKFFAG